MIRYLSEIENPTNTVKARTETNTSLGIVGCGNHHQPSHRIRCISEISTYDA